MNATASLSRAATVGDAVVSVRGLSKSYGGRLVVDDLDLDVLDGEVVGLIGANGAGKTTAVECLQGLRRPDAGRIRVLGLDPARDAERLRPQLGSQLQDSGLPDRLRVREAVDLFAGPDAADPTVLLEQFGIAHRYRTPFAGLSGGERQRLFLVLALLNRPRLVILDELTQGLDPAARHGVWAAVDQLRQNGTTVLLVTHELAEAEALCDRVVAMRAGQVLDQGTPAELIARHAGQAIIRFTLPATDDATTATALQQLNRLPAVQSVTRTTQTVTVRGGRAIIAHVGAWLTTRPDPIPPDLDVAEDLQRAVRALAGGGAWLDPAITSRVLTSYREGAPPIRPGTQVDLLTPREKDVLALIGAGLSNAEIATELFLGVGTVKTHIGHIFTKLGLRDRAAAVIFAFDHGLVRPGDPRPAPDTAG